MTEGEPAVRHRCANGLPRCSSPMSRLSGAHRRVAAIRSNSMPCAIMITAGHAGSLEPALVRMPCGLGPPCNEPLKGLCAKRPASSSEIRSAQRSPAHRMLVQAECAAGGGDDETLKRFAAPRSPLAAAALVPPPPWHFASDVLAIEFWNDPMCRSILGPRASSSRQIAPDTLSRGSWTISPPHKMNSLRSHPLPLSRIQRCPGRNVEGIAHCVVSVFLC